MSENTRSFLIALGENPDTAARYIADPTAVMSAHEVPVAHQQLFLAGDKDGLIAAAGLDDEHAKFFIV